MKYLIIIFFIVFYSLSSYAQNASNYFPTNPGFKWYYKEIHLDYQNNPVDTTYRIDSFATVSQYNGHPENIVKTKNNLLSFDQNIPYSESILTSPVGTIMNTFYKFSDINDPSYINIFNQMDGWLDVYRFGDDWSGNILTFQLDNYVRLIFDMIGFDDDVIIVGNHSYNTKRLSFTLRFYSFETYIGGQGWFLKWTRNSTVWVTNDKWIVKESIPSYYALGSGFNPFSHYVLGKTIELVDPTTEINQNNTIIPTIFKLYNNFPNPFNPYTAIKFDVAKNAFVNLEVFDETGKKVADLFHGNLNTGQYQFNFNAENLSSGSYFCKLSADNFSQTMRMILVK